MPHGKGYYRSMLMALFKGSKFKPRLEVDTRSHMVFTIEGFTSRLLSSRIDKKQLKWKPISEGHHLHLDKRRRHIYVKNSGGELIQMKYNGTKLKRFQLKNKHGFFNLDFHGEVILCDECLGQKLVEYEITKYAVKTTAVEIENIQCDKVWKAGQAIYVTMSDGRLYHIKNNALGKRVGEIKNTKILLPMN